jgi:hypothetical protein
VRLAVYFEDPFRVALAERLDGERLRAVRYVFGAEPSDPAVLAFAPRELSPGFDRATVAVVAPQTAERRRSPKRAARMAAKLVAAHGGSSKAHGAMRRQAEANARARHVDAREARDHAAEHKRGVAREKPKQRHRGH